MTILVYDNGKIYTDSLCTGNNTVLSTDAPKVFFTKHAELGDIMLAGAGSFPAIQDLVRQITSGQTSLAPKNEDVELFAVDLTGKVYDFYGSVSRQLEGTALLDGRWFGGSGSNMALAIMQHGETCPVKTIETVIRCNISCGGDVMSYGLNTTGFSVVNESESS